MVFPNWVNERVQMMIMDDIGKKGDREFMAEMETIGKIKHRNLVPFRIINLGDNQVCVMPAGSTSSSGSFKKYISLPKLNEMELVVAVVSGNLDPSIMKSAPVVVTSSCSTDETVVADFDEELETATSIRASVVVNLIESADDECKEKIAVDRGFQPQNIVHVVDSSTPNSGQNIASPKIEHGSQGFLAPNQVTSKPDDPYRTDVKSDNVNIILSKDRDGTFESENLYIIYCQNLIVRESNITQSTIWSFFKKWCSYRLQTFQEG